jgi:hypothetical protein
MSVINTMGSTFYYMTLHAEGNTFSGYDLCNYFLCPYIPCILGLIKVKQDKI